MNRRLAGTFAAGAAAAALTLTACSAAVEHEGSTGPSDSVPGSAGEGAGEDALTIESNLGEVAVGLPAESVVVLDNRAFRLLDEWNVTPAAAARSLMRPDLTLASDESVPDVGNHREPNLELIVAAQPDLVVSGQRFTEYNEQISSLVPEAALVDFTPREGEPFDEELRRHVTSLGQLFGRDAEAAELVSEFDQSIARATEAYDPDDTVIAVITSGGEINYAAPYTGRSLGPVFEVLGLTPALEVDNSSTDHEGDDISVEAIADANPDWILVLDRDAAVGDSAGEEYTPASELLADSAALENVTAVREEQIVYMPQYTYTDEGIQTYTEFFTSLADAMESR